VNFDSNEDDLKEELEELGAELEQQLLAPDNENELGTIYKRWEEENDK
jgi:molybdopterin-biosynthesis enzyme MoeA-like protein